jgi:hypothetical protein
MSYTTSDLLSSIKRRGMIPSSQVTFQDTDLLSMATEEIQIELLPLLIGVREEYYVRSYDYAITSATQSYRVPVRAVGMGLRDVLYRDSTTGVMYPLSQITTSEDSGEDETNLPYLYYLCDNSVYLTPIPSTTNGTLRLLYYCRPGKLVETSDAAQITVITTGTNTVTCSAAPPSTWTTATSVDFIRGTGGQEYLAIDQAISSVSGSDIVFSSLPTGLAVGDWIAAAGYSPLPQLPEELQPVLAQKVVCQVLEALGDAQGLQLHQARLKSLLDNALKLISPRVKGGQKKVISTSYF